MENFAAIAQGMVKSKRENTLNLVGETINSLLLYFPDDKKKIEALKTFAQCLKDNKSLLRSFTEATKSS